MNANANSINNIAPITKYTEKVTPVPAPAPVSNRITPSQCRSMNFRQCICGTCGCFSGDDNVLMFDDTTKKVRDIIPGDIVHCGAVVVTKVIIHSDDMHTNMVTLPNGGPTMTAYHPVFNRDEMKWMHPINIAPINEAASCRTVYNFVLADWHRLTVNGYECITLGHGNTTDPVLKHPYYGTEKVIEDLKRRPDYPTGTVIYLNPVVIRDDNGMVAQIL
jgi:hypothetical protein